MKTISTNSKNQRSAEKMCTKCKKLRLYNHFWDNNFNKINFFNKLFVFGNILKILDKKWTQNAKLVNFFINIGFLLKSEHSLILNLFNLFFNTTLLLNKWKKEI